jgi:hypothetical protein
VNDGIYRTDESIAEAEARGEALIRVGAKLVVGGKVYEGDALPDGTRGPLAIRSDLLNSGALAPRSERRASARGPGRAQPYRHRPRSIDDLLAMAKGA